MLLSYYSRAAAHAATEGLAEGHDRVHLFNPASAPANCTARFVKWGVDLIERLEQGALGEGMQLWVGQGGPASQLESLRRRMGRWAQLPTEQLAACRQTVLLVMDNARGERVVAGHSHRVEARFLPARLCVFWHHRVSSEAEALQYGEAYSRPPSPVAVAAALAAAPDGDEGVAEELVDTLVGQPQPQPQPQQAQVQVRPQAHGQTQAAQAAAQTEPEQQHPTCYVCNTTDRDESLLLCDGLRRGLPCNRACHTDCLALSAVPQGDWLCNRCEAKGKRVCNACNGKVLGAHDARNCPSRAPAAKTAPSSKRAAVSAKVLLTRNELFREHVALALAKRYLQARGAPPGMQAEHPFTEQLDLRPEEGLRGAHQALARFIGHAVDEVVLRGRERSREQFDRALPGYADNWRLAAKGAAPTRVLGHDMALRVPRSVVEVLFRIVDRVKLPKGAGVLACAICAAHLCEESRERLARAETVLDALDALRERVERVDYGNGAEAGGVEHAATSEADGAEPEATTSETDGAELDAVTSASGGAKKSAGQENSAPPNTGEFVSRCAKRAEGGANDDREQHCKRRKLALGATGQHDASPPPAAAAAADASASQRETALAALVQALKAEVAAASEERAALQEQHKVGLVVARDKLGEKLTTALATAHEERDKLRKKLTADVAAAHAERDKLRKKLTADLAAVQAERNELRKKLEADAAAARAERDALQEHLSAEEAASKAVRDALHTQLRDLRRDLCMARARANTT
jgi:hypothetical protein